MRTAPQFDFRHRPASCAEPRAPLPPRHSEWGVRDPSAHSCLIYLFARCNLSRLQKGFDEFAFAANGQTGKFLEPFAFRHFGVGAQPICDESKLGGGNVSVADAVKQMVEQARRQILSANPRHIYCP